jgi:hypothetical protein
VRKERPDRILREGAPQPRSGRSWESLETELCLSQDITLLGLRNTRRYMSGVLNKIFRSMQYYGSRPAERLSPSSRSIGVEFCHGSALE